MLAPTFTVKLYEYAKRKTHNRQEYKKYRDKLGISLDDLMK